MYVCPKCFEENSRLGAQCPRDGAYFIPRSALQDAKQDPLIGSLMADKFIITSLVSEGGMGAVYRALQMPVEREIAFKVLLTELQDSDKGRDRFTQEARAISKLQHPNIITLFDFGFSQTGHPYMAMEYAPGVSLAQWGLSPNLTIDRILHVFEQILAALGEAHRQGIIHRDLKPDNMIITRAGDDTDFVKLLDFGIARITNENATRGLTREGEVFGTPHYMAPEQAQGKKNVGPPADVYAIGIMFYEMLCGEAPFDASSPLSVLFMHINEPMPPIKPRPGLTVPRPIEDIILRATQKKPEDRYADASQMLQALYESVGRTTGTLSAAAVLASARTSEITVLPSQYSQNTAIPTPQPAPLAPPDTPAAQSAAAVNLGQFALPNATEPPLDPQIRIDTLSGDIQERPPKKRTLIIALAAILVVILGSTVVFYANSSGQSTKTQETTLQNPDESPTTASAKVEIPKIDLAPQSDKPASDKPAPDQLVQQPEIAAPDSETPQLAENPTENTNAAPAPSDDAKPTQRKAAGPAKATTRQKFEPALNKRPSKETSTRPAQKRTEEPVKFSPPKFNAPEEIPTKFERPK